MKTLTAREMIKKARNALHALFPLIGAARFGIPGKELFVIGITGTDGKSSSVLLSAAMLRAAGHKVAHFSSVSYHDGDREFPNDMKMTTPGRMRLHAFLDRARKNGCSHAVIEVTSEGILQHRHRLIGFSLIGITNITPEHVEAHGGFERYQRAKARLARSLRHGNRGLVIYADTYESIQSLLPRGVTIHLVRRDAIAIKEETPFRTIIDFPHDGRVMEMQSELGGPFSGQNIVFAATVASVCGVKEPAIVEAIRTITCIPGRFEVVSRRPLVIVDYAHTLAALAILLPYVREHTKGKLVHVFGAAGGGRDRYKRPLVATLSEKYADVSVLTEENSFDEPIENILSGIQRGFSAGHPVRIIPERERAVEFARTLITSADDTLLLTAKGSESVIAGPHGTMRPYSERTYVRCLFEASSSA